MPPDIISASDAKIGVMIVEDQTAIRQMLMRFVAAMPQFRVVGEAGSAEEALRVAARARPEVVVLDWMLLEGIGLEFLREVDCDPRPQVLVVSANTRKLSVREALSAGARGYIEKTASFSEFTAALNAVAAGQTYIGPAIARAVRRIGLRSVAQRALHAVRLGLVQMPTIGEKAS